MYDFLTVNGYFSKLWPSDDGVKYNAYFDTGRCEYYVQGSVESNQSMPQEYQKASLKLKLARDKGNQIIMRCRGQKKLWYVEQIGPDLSERDGLFKYLTSKIFDGIGDVTANALLDKYGLNVLEIVQTDPGRLEQDGFTSRQVDILQDGLRDPAIANYLMQTLPDMPQSCAKALGDYYDSIQRDAGQIKAVLQKDPYQIYRDLIEYCDVKKPQAKDGFIAVDHYAILNQFPDDHLYRINAAIDVAIGQLSGYTSSTFLDVSDPGIYDALMKECVSCLWYGDIQKSMAAVGKQVPARLSCCENRQMLYTKRLLQAEQDAAEIVKILLNAPAFYFINNVDLNDLIDQYRSPEGFELDTQQKEAVKAAMTRRLSVITGGPGTGKTTILDAVVWVWNQILALNKSNMPPFDPEFYKTDSKTGRTVYLPLELDQIFLMAPTGKAAQRMNEKVKSRGADNMATTIRMRLMMAAKDSSDKGRTPTYYKQKLAIIDETSMVGMTDAADLLNLMQDCQLVFVGDPDQLLPVGPGQFLTDLIGCLEFSQYPGLIRLNTQHRSGNNNALIQNAGIIKNGGIWENGVFTPGVPPTCPGQYELVELNEFGAFVSDTDIKSLAVAEYVAQFRRDPNNICLITPMHPGACAACNDRNMNIEIQNIVNPRTNLDPNGGRMASIETGGRVYTGRLYGLMPGERYDRLNSNLLDAWGGGIRDAAYLEYNQKNSGQGANGLVTTLRVGDRVMLTKNNYSADMFNGDVGVIVGYLVTPKYREENLIIIKPDTLRVDGSEFCCVRSGRFNEIDLAYCLTVHKTQGSEYAHVILALPGRLTYNPLGNRSLFYTAETRTKSCIKIIARPETVRYCIGTLPVRRDTMLIQRIMGPAGYVKDPEDGVFA